MRLKPKIIPLSTRIGLLIAAGSTIGGQRRHLDSRDGQQDGADGDLIQIYFTRF